MIVVLSILTPTLGRQERFALIPTVSLADSHRSCHGQAVAVKGHATLRHAT